MNQEEHKKDNLYARNILFQEIWANHALKKSILSFLGHPKQNLHNINNQNHQQKIQQPSNIKPQVHNEEDISLNHQNLPQIKQNHEIIQEQKQLHKQILQLKSLHKTQKQPQNPSLHLAPQQTSHNHSPTLLTTAIQKIKQKLTSSISSIKLSLQTNNNIYTIIKQKQIQQFIYFINKLSQLQTEDICDNQFINNQEKCQNEKEIQEKDQQDMIDEGKIEYKDIGKIEKIVEVIGKCQKNILQRIAFYHLTMNIEAQVKQTDQIKNVDSERVSSQKGNRSISSRGSRKKSSGDEEINLQLTFKTKISKNMSSHNNKNDSLMYSNATYFQTDSPSKPLHKNLSSQQKLLQIKDLNQQQLNEQIDKAQSKNYDEKIQIDDSWNDLQTKIQNRIRNKSQFERQKDKHHQILEIKEEYSLKKIHQNHQMLMREVRSSSNLAPTEAVSQKKRVETEHNSTNQSRNQGKFKKINEREHSESAHSQIFQTEINDYKTRIAKIKEVKELKKKKLQQQLFKINNQLQQIRHKQQEIISSPNSQANNYESRIKISDNVDAKIKAEKFVKNLRSQKRNRQAAKLGQFTSIDKNINNYMEELMKERYKNQEKIKQKKKLQIIERMKQQELRKISEQKKKDQTSQFVNNLKSALPIQKNVISNPKVTEISEKRSPTKRSEPLDEIQLTPELAKKKIYLSKLRNFSIRKQKKDLYEQLLS